MPGKPGRAKSPHAMSAQRDPIVIDTQGLDALIGALAGQGYQVIGPTVRDEAIAYAPIDGFADLPAGWTDEQDGGHYRLRPRDDNAVFGYAVGPHSWKHYLHPPRLRLWRAERDSEGLRFTEGDDSPPRYAFIGVRACELHAIAIQDRVLLGGEAVDPHYRARREDAFLVAVNCGVAGGTCFCRSMGTGPTVDGDYDLALTEFTDATGQRFVVDIGSAAGVAVLADIPHETAAKADRQRARDVVEDTARHMGRSMPDTDLPALLRDNREHPRWDDVAERCLTCGNCTMVCPTCFCTSVEDHTDLAGTSAERTRHWASCFTLGFSYVHGGSVRSSARARYRQWLTHKLGTWVEQFGTSGCVGCGRCITWCPVGIDITEEIHAINAGRGSEGAES